MIAIVGAAGKVGHATSIKLREAGVPVRAILRDAAKGDRFRAIGCEVARADLRDPAALAQALAGAAAVQIILPPSLQAHDAPGEMGRTADALAEALERARPERVLAISDYGAHVAHDIGMPTVFHRFEARLRQLPMHHVFLRSAEHIEGWARLAPIAIASGTVPTFHQSIDVAFPTVSAADVGVIAADLLQQPHPGAGPHPGNRSRVVHAEGPRRYTANDVAKALGTLLGRTVTALPLPRAQWQATLVRQLDPSAAKLLVDFYDACNAGGLVDVEPDGEVRRGTTELVDALRPVVTAS